MSRHGRLQPGQVFVSAPGWLPCEKVIHAVGPRWQGGQNNEENILREAVYESLLSAEQCGLSSIALPALSMGIFGCPLDRCTKVIVSAIKGFLDDHKQTCVKRVSLVGPTDRVVDAFHTSLQALTCQQRVTTSVQSHREGTSGGSPLCFIHILKIIAASTLLDRNGKPLYIELLRSSSSCYNTARRQTLSTTNRRESKQKRFLFRKCRATNFSLTNHNCCFWCDVILHQVL